MASCIASSLSWRLCLSEERVRLRGERWPARGGLHYILGDPHEWYPHKTLACIERAGAAPIRLAGPSSTGKKPRCRTHSPQPGLQHIPQGITKQVKPQHGDEDGETRK